MSSLWCSERAGRVRKLAAGVELVGKCPSPVERPSVIHYLCGPPPSEIGAVGGGARPACAIRDTRCWVQNSFGVR